MHLLIAVLTLAGVVEAAVAAELVVVPVLLSDGRAPEDEDVGRGCRWADPALRATAPSRVQLLADNRLAGLKRLNAARLVAILQEYQEKS